MEKGKDNVLPKLMASADHPDALFATELKKYDPWVERVDTNVAKQAQLLGVLARSQADYRAVFGFQEWRQACEVGGGLWAKGFFLGVFVLQTAGVRGLGVPARSPGRSSASRSGARPARRTVDLQGFSFLSLCK